ncbi:uncharacterized protein LOC122432082 [Cervus canadensis]|uniref:uncharacterized protein LOC122432082 n=1 Tax=Cervus canadensis TaxID=1574408 RepID=UPI001CA3064C|nr:uncharacterized protein LOC122432082 [Cervus canadensis]
MFIIGIEILTALGCNAGTPRSPSAFQPEGVSSASETSPGVNKTRCLSPGVEVKRKSTPSDVSLCREGALCPIPHEEKGNPERSGQARLKVRQVGWRCQEKNSEQAGFHPAHQLLQQTRRKSEKLAEPRDERVMLETPLCCCLVTQLCLSLCDPVDCSPARSSVHGILQAGILEWVAFSFSGDLPDPGIEPMVPAPAGGFCTTEPPGMSLKYPNHRESLDCPQEPVSFLFSDPSRLQQCWPWVSHRRGGPRGQEHLGSLGPCRVSPGVGRGLRTVRRAGPDRDLDGHTPHGRHVLTRSDCLPSSHRSAGLEPRVLQKAS